MNLTPNVSRLSAPFLQKRPMKRMTLHMLLSGSAVAIALSAVTVQADDDIGHDQARILVEQGVVQPLDKILEMLAKRVPGKVLATELERDDGRYEYDFKVLTDGGRLLEVEVDAASGTVLSVEDDD